MDNIIKQSQKKPASNTQYLGAIPKLFDQQTTLGMHCSSSCWTHSVICSMVGVLHDKILKCISSHFKPFRIIYPVMKGVDQIKEIPYYFLRLPLSVVYSLLQLLALDVGAVTPVTPVLSSAQPNIFMWHRHNEIILDDGNRKYLNFQHSI